MLYGMYMRRNKPLYLIFFIPAVIGHITGLFYDLEISRALYSENNTLAVILSVIGLYLHYGSFVFFIGVLCKQLSLLVQKRGVRILIFLIYTIDFHIWSGSPYDRCTILLMDS